MPAASQRFFSFHFHRNIKSTSKALLILLIGSTYSVCAGADTILDTMEKEQKRAMKALAKDDDAPYFISYEIREIKQISMNALFGATMQAVKRHERILTVDLHVGSYQFDNTRQIRTNNAPAAQTLNLQTRINLPMDDSQQSLQSILWRETDKKFREAKSMLARVRTSEGISVDLEDNSGDFSKEKPENYVGDFSELNASEEQWQQRLRTYTKVFKNDPNILQARANYDALIETRWLVNTEGTKIRDVSPQYRLIIIATTRAEDGMALPRYASFFARDPSRLPDDTTILAEVKQMVTDLAALRDAPVVEPYTGPAILIGRASAVFFHEVFGHRIEGHRQKNVNEGQTFTSKLDTSILPDNFSVYFDPNLQELAETPLAGYYQFDNQGVRGKRVDAVQHGKFQNFLMSRTPIEGFPNSNGHGRSQLGFQPVARQSNLVVEVENSLSTAQLKDRLIQLVKEQGKPYGLIFVDIEGGFTLTGRTIPNAFNVTPIMVYRIYPDGKEELVRGVDLIGTPLTAFSKVVAADDQLGVFNGMCGAESGQVPVSAVSPGILLSQIEVQRKQIPQQSLPILPPPLSSLDKK